MCIRDSPSMTRINQPVASGRLRKDCMSTSSPPGSPSTSPSSGVAEHLTVPRAWCERNVCPVPERKIKFIARCPRHARKATSKAVLTRMRLTYPSCHSPNKTSRFASRLVQAMPAWSVKTRRAPSRNCRDARVYDHTTTAMHGVSTPAPLPTRDIDAPPPS